MADTSMPEVEVCMQSGDSTTALGRHRLLALPARGDAVLLYVEGELMAVTVEAVHHFSRPSNGLGPSGGPGLMLVVSERPE